MDSATVNTEEWALRLNRDLIGARALIAALEAQLDEAKAENERLEKERDYWQSQHDERTRQLGMSDTEATPPAPKVTEALKAALTTMYRYQRAGCGDDVFYDDLSQSIRKVEAALTASEVK